MVFVSHNLSLTPLSANDADAIVSCMRDKEISENTLHIPYPYTLEHAQSWIADNLIFEEENGFARNYAIRNESGTLIGTIGLQYNYGLDADKSAFGYWLGKPYWNRGIMTAMIKVFCQIALEKHKLKMLEACAFTTNPGSQRALLKAGFTQLEKTTCKRKTNGAKVDAWNFEKDTVAFVSTVS